MSDNDMAEFQREGEITFDATDTEEETTADSPSEEENQGGETAPTQRENNEPSDTTPFDQHPRWQERERDWNSRFNEQETRHTNDMKSIREEFAGRREANAEATKIPAWFGGDQAQWDAYRADQDAALRKSEERVLATLESKRSEVDKATEEATTYLRSEVAAIQADKTLNPSGAAIDVEKLFKTVYDNQLVDTQGRWNYRAAFRIMQGAAPAPAARPAPVIQARKEAGADGKGSGGGEPKPKDYMTSDDFKNDRPW